MIEHNRERKEKQPLVRARRGRARARGRGRGRARRGAVRRGRDRARWSRTGTSLGEIAVVYRTNAQSRVLEDVLVRQGVAYQVIGGPRFYERAEIKDAIAYLQAIDNPTDARLAHADREPAAARRGGHLARAAADVRRRRSADLALGGGRPRRGGRPRDRVAARGAVAALAAAVADGAGAGGARSPSCSSGCSSAPATSSALEAERTMEARGEDREPRGARRRRARVRGREGAEEPSLSAVPAGDLALLRPGRRCATTRRAAR